jgi:hypothetical protein
MLLVFIIFLSFTFVFLGLKKAFGSRVWLMIVLLTLVSSVILAYTSVSSVWVPNQLSDTVFHQQDALGEYEGTFPYAKLSHPLYLNVYHTPFDQLTFEERRTAHGEVRLTMYFAGVRIFRVDGVFQYFYAVHGPTPLHYRLDFPLTGSPEFFGFLLALFFFFNVAGPFIAALLGWILHRRGH